MAQETRVSTNRGMVQLYVRVPSKKIPLFKGFQVDLETDVDLRMKLDTAIRRLEKK